MSLEQWQAIDRTSKEVLASYGSERETQSYVDACNERTARVVDLVRVMFCEECGRFDKPAECSWCGGS